MAEKKEKAPLFQVIIVVDAERLKELPSKRKAAVIDRLTGLYSVVESLSKNIEELDVPKEKKKDPYCPCTEEYNGGMTGPPADLKHTKGCPWAPKGKKK